MSSKTKIKIRVTHTRDGWWLHLTNPKTKQSGGVHFKYTLNNGMGICDALMLAAAKQGEEES
jgi:hypothetical protein